MLLSEFGRMWEKTPPNTASIWRLSKRRSFQQAKHLGHFWPATPGNTASILRGSIILERKQAKRKATFWAQRPTTWPRFHAIHAPEDVPPNVGIGAILGATPGNTASIWKILNAPKCPPTMAIALVKESTPLNMKRKKRKSTSQKMIRG